MFIFSRPILAVALLSIIVTAQSLTAQQQTPRGSCFVPNVGWCWPSVPTGFGQPCLCPNPNGGSYNGIMR